MSTRTHTKDIVEDVVKQRPDLIVLDVMFPEDPQAGFIAARELYDDERVRDIPVILLSAVNARSELSFGFSDSDISDDFMPVEAFIDKPVEPKILLERIDTLLSK